MLAQDQMTRARTLATEVIGTDAGAHNGKW
jgi:hypothetical protein